MDFEARISKVLSLSDKDTRRMDRVISDLSDISGMEKIEILDYLRYGSEKELKELQESYHWEKFRIQIQKKLVKR